MSGQVASFGGLARRLVNEGLVSAEVMQKALAESQREKLALVNYLVSRKLANAAQIAWLIAREFGDPILDLDSLDQEQIPKDIVDEKIIRQYGALPIFKRGNRLFIAMSDPTRVDAIDDAAKEALRRQRVSLKDQIWSMLSVAAA